MLYTYSMKFRTIIIRLLQLQLLIKVHKMTAKKSINPTLLIFFCLVIITNTLTKYSPNHMNSNKQKLAPKTAPIVRITTETVLTYHGTIDIQITDGEQKSVDFFVNLTPETSCNYTKCFTGWISNYT
jgi:hypothetical protein